MPFVSLPHPSGASIFYRERGEGAPLVLIMGTGADHTSWARQTPVLAQHFRVITPDQRGSGRSTPPPDDTLTTTQLATEMVAFCDALGVDRFHVAGYSLGAAVTLEVALAVPHRVMSASVHAGWAGPNAITTPALEQSLERLRSASGVEAFLEAACRRNFSPAFQNDDPKVFADFLYNVTHSVTRPSLAGARAQAHAGARHDCRSRLPGLRVPVLVTAGEHDPLAPPAVAEEIARLIPGAELHIFRGPRAWHAIPLEMAAEFNTLLIRFHGQNDESGAHDRSGP